MYLRVKTWVRSEKLRKIYVVEALDKRQKEADMYKQFWYSVHLFIQLLNYRNNRPRLLRQFSW